jgi:hypothetical protein
MGDNTMWYTISTTSGDDMINLSQLTRIIKNGATTLRIYGPDTSVGYVDHMFTTAAIRDDVFRKLKKLLDAKTVNDLPPQED